MARDAQLTIAGTIAAPTRTRSAAPPRLRAPQGRTGLALAAQAGQILTEAATWINADERFRLAHLGALRTAAALFADRARPSNRRPTNAWVLLAQVAPELSDWASYFAAGASKRAAIESGAQNVVTAREADDLVRAASEFLTMVEVSLGVFADARAS